MIKSFICEADKNKMCAAPATETPATNGAGPEAPKASILIICFDQAIYS